MTTATITLSAEARDTAAKTKDLRKNFRVPAVLYGHGTENVNISCQEQEFHKAYIKAGESTMIELECAGKKTPVLIHKVTLDPVSNNYEHIDFFAPDMSKEVTANVPVHITGESLAVKDLGGILVRSRESVTVKCLPKDLPSEFVLDISVLENLNDSLLVSDVKAPDAVTVIDAEDLMIVTVQPPRKEEEETPVVAEGEEGETAEGEATEGDDAAKEKEGEGGETPEGGDSDSSK